MLKYSWNYGRVNCIYLGNERAWNSAHLLFSYLSFLQRILVHAFVIDCPVWFGITFCYVHGTISVALCICVWIPCIDFCSDRAELCLRCLLVKACSGPLSSWLLVFRLWIVLECLERVPKLLGNYVIMHNSSSFFILTFGFFLIPWSWASCLTG